MFNVYRDIFWPKVSKEVKVVVQEKPIKPLPELGPWDMNSAMKSLWRGRLGFGTEKKAGPLPPEIMTEY